jgi:hypothetical protein
MLTRLRRSNAEKATRAVKEFVTEHREPAQAHQVGAILGCVSRRQLFRWIADARELGLIREGRGYWPSDMPEPGSPT